MTIRNFKVLYDCKNFSLYHSGGNHLKKKISILLIILLCLFQNSTISFAESSANDVSGVPEKVKEQINEEANKEMVTNFKTASSKHARVG